MARHVWKPTAAIVVRNPLLRNLVREDLERGGFAVTSVTATDTGEGAEVLVTDVRNVTRGSAATVRINGAIEFDLLDRTVIYPLTAVGDIPDIIRAETQRKAS